MVDSASSSGDIGNSPSKNEAKIIVSLNGQAISREIVSRMKSSQIAKERLIDEGREDNKIRTALP